mgnify:CR=1 FL=1
MALEVKTENLVITVSQLVKVGNSAQKVLDADIVSQIEQVVQELLSDKAGVVVEVELA